MEHDEIVVHSREGRDGCLWRISGERRPRHPEAVSNEQDHTGLATDTLLQGKDHFTNLFLQASGVDGKDAAKRYLRGVLTVHC